MCQPLNVEAQRWVQPEQATSTVVIDRVPRAPHHVSTLEVEPRDDSLTTLAVPLDRPTGLRACACVRVRACVVHQQQPESEELVGLLVELLAHPLARGADSGAAQSLLMPSIKALPRLY